MRTIVMMLSLAALATSASYAADTKDGQAAYGRACKSCHGADGTPNPAIGKMMKVDMRDLKSPDVQSQSDADLKKIITEGKGKMRPITSVTGASIDNVIAYVRSLKK